MSTYPAVAIIAGRLVHFDDVPKLGRSLDANDLAPQYGLRAGGSYTDRMIAQRIKVNDDRFMAAGLGYGTKHPDFYRYISQRRSPRPDPRPLRLPPPDLPAPATAASTALPPLAPASRDSTSSSSFSSNSSSFASSSSSSSPASRSIPPFSASPSLTPRDTGSSLDRSLSSPPADATASNDSSSRSSGGSSNSNPVPPPRPRRGIGTAHIRWRDSRPPSSARSSESAMVRSGMPKSRV